MQWSTIRDSRVQVAGRVIRKSLGASWRGWLVVPALLGVHFTAVVIELFLCFVAKVFGATMSEDMVAPLV